jgi:hypothetical protein
MLCMEPCYDLSRRSVNQPLNLCLTLTSVKNQRRTELGICLPPTVKNLNRFLILGAVLILIILGAIAYEYYQGQRERDVINILKQEGVWHAGANYEKFVDVDVDSLPKPSGEWTYKTVTVNYTFLSQCLNCELQLTYILNPTRSCYTGFNPYFDYWGPTTTRGGGYYCYWYAYCSHFLPLTTYRSTYRLASLSLSRHGRLTTGSVYKRLRIPQELLRHSLADLLR